MLQIENLRISYPQANRNTTKSAWTLFIPLLSIYPGKISYLYGVNGCGKTSLLNAISGVIPAHIPGDRNGSIHWEKTNLSDIPLNEMYHFMAYQMSDCANQFLFPTLEHEVAFSLENMGLPVAEIHLRLKKSLHKFELDSYTMAHPDQLSVGQQKLALFAMIDVLDAPLILLDEPCSGLSDKAYALLLNWLLEQKGHQKTILIAEHDSRIKSIIDNIIQMEQYVQG